MITLLIAVLTIGGDDQFTRSSPEITVGKRVVAAIEGKAEFRDEDFVKPLTARDKAALRQFAGCKVRRIRHTGTPVPGDLFTIVENADEVGIGFDCKGVPYETPAGISLSFQNGKIVKVETHNADLMRSH